jgi:hypothetical protein
MQRERIRTSLFKSKKLFVGRVGCHILQLFCLYLQESEKRKEERGKWRGKQEREKEYLLYIISLNIAA